MVEDHSMLNRQIAGVMWKTVSEACNLACDYCYYSSCNGIPEKIDRIEDQTLEKFIQEYMKLKKGYVPFTWQGGEPLLAGLDFFKRVVQLQTKYAAPHTVIYNAIQTNGTLINREWAEFFKEYRFLVGISLDGPKEINDVRRITGSGKGSFELVMRGIEHLKEANVDFNILTVVHEANVSKGRELMQFYEREEYTHVQFIPCMKFKAQNVGEQGQYTITPKQYGDFLCEVFDIWYNDGNPKRSVRFFDNVLGVYLNQQPEMCQQSESCPKVLVLEQNGDAYPCDFFIQDDYKLGNVREHSLESIINSEKWNDFLSLKQSLPEPCQSCEFLKMCHGGCPRNRMQQNNEMGVEYFCEGYKQIFKYSQNKMLKLAGNIKRDRLLELEKKGFKFPKRNERCICGSSKKYKNCCEPLLKYPEEISL